MHSRVWLAYAVITGLALAATLPNKARQSKEGPNISPLTLVFPGNVSAATTEASYLDDKPPTVNDASQQSSNDSSLYDPPFGNDTVAASHASPMCDGLKYGRNLDEHSCFDAWRNLGLEPDPRTWGPRGGSYKFKYTLPARWSSGMPEKKILCHEHR